MVNSVSISWLLPSLQRTAQAYRSLQKSSGFDSLTVQSFILRPRATNQCQQTFHWNHMNPPLFPSSFFFLIAMQPFLSHFYLLLFLHAPISFSLFPFLHVGLCKKKGLWFVLLQCSSVNVSLQMQSKSSFSCLFPLGQMSTIWEDNPVICPPSQLILYIKTHASWF